MLKAVLMDIGGPINDETEQEQRFDDAALGAARRFRDVSAEEYVDIAHRAVESFAPRAYRFIMWHLAGQDESRYREIQEHVQQADYARFQLRPEVPGILKRLAERYVLGLAANSGREMLDHLEEAGILQYFTSQKPGALLGLDKPDPRYFEAVLTELDVDPGDAVMVGDRIDCDIAPARLLGMKAVRLRTGRHAAQEARTPEERPDAELEAMDQLEEVIESW